MKTKKEFLEIAELLNVARLDNQGRELNIRELTEILKGILPTNDFARTRFIRAGILVRASRGKYRFPDKPIHWTYVQNYYDQERTFKRNRRIKADLAKPMKEIPTKVAQKTEILEPAYEETKAVAFLKNHGYVILKMM